MEETHILYETAKLAAEKGFDEFDKNNNRVFCEIEDSVFFHKPVQNHHEDSYNANYKHRCPTQAFLQTWLRDEHEIIMVALPYTTEIKSISPSYIWMIYNKSASTKDHEPFSTYEDAMEHGLIEALKLIGL